MTFLDTATGEWQLEAKSQAARPALCLCCNSVFRQNADRGVYGMTFCGACIDSHGGKMPAVLYPANEYPEPVQ